MSSTPFLKNIAVVGAGGNIGSVIVEVLLAKGQHTITAITRPDSTSTLHPDLHHIQKVDLANHTSLISALKGQDILIISLNVMAAPSTQTDLINAAAEAGVRYIIPNEYGGNYSNAAFGDSVGLGGKALAIRKHIEEKGMKWIAICCGFWYEFSLSGAELRYGFDFPGRKFTMFGDGEQKITTSTWPQVGRAVAAVLALPEKMSDGGSSIEKYGNSQVVVASFRVNQKDMFASVLRVTGTKESDWTISHEDVEARYKRGREMMMKGDMVGFGIQLYSRSFFPDGKADNFEMLQNEELGLPWEEDLDEATRVAVGYSESGKNKAWTMGQ
ncbi:hypothetical protein LTR86_003153 [Recurvomyces mirabilis]|nr:hypothetical protein LTR86_003153 [Recurvomyces mirabilis]